MKCQLKDYKEFIDNEMLLILGQMDKATLIFDHVYLVGRVSGTETFFLIYSSHPKLKELNLGNISRKLFYPNLSPGFRMERF